MDLFEAINKADLIQIEASLRDGSGDMNALKGGKTALHLAIEKRLFLPTKMLIEAGVGLDIQDSDGNTPLMKAVKMKDAQISGMLLDAGANPDIQDKVGDTPLIMAAMTGDARNVKQLLDVGANPDIQGQYGYTSLYRAADMRNRDIIKQLLDAGANPDIQNSSGWTALHIAALRDYAPSIEILIEGNANPHICESSSKLPSHFATTRSVLERLREYEKSYKPGEQKVVRRERPVPKGKGVLATADNIARLDRLLAKKKTGGGEEKGEREANIAPAVAAGETKETWLYFLPSRVARIDDMAGLDLRLKDIFDFEARCQIKIAEQLSTGAISVETKEFDGIQDKTMLEKALSRFIGVGGEVDPAVIQTGYRVRKKSSLDELRKKGI